MAARPAGRARRVVPSAGKSAAASPAPEPEAIPDGAAYAMARWRELLSDDVPWWARSNGIGIRMRLVELAQVSDLFAKGGLAAQSIDALRTEAVRELTREDSFCARHFDEIVQEVRRGLRDRRAEALLPQGHAISGARAALDHFEASRPRQRIAAELASQTEATTTGLLDLEGIETTTELLDAELAFDGHAVAYRRALVDRVDGKRSDGATCSDALAGALDELRSGDVRQFDAILPLREVEPGRAAAWLQPETAEDLSPIIQSWSDATVLDEWDGAWRAGQRYPELEASDPFAAAQAASERFRRDSGLWRLLQGSVQWAGVVFVDDPVGGQSLVVQMPLEQVPLAPPGVESVVPNTRPQLDDAIMQLAQARSAAPATALADIWAAAETTFGGVQLDPNHEIARHLGDLAAALYPRDLLGWLAQRCEAHGIDLDRTQAEPAMRLLNTIHAPGAPRRLLAELLEAGDVLAWKRLKRVLDWPGEGFANEVLAVRERMTEVANRAYLMRNLQVHRGEWRMKALPVTLPAFADLVRTCIAHVMTIPPEKPPEVALIVAKRAAMTVVKVADAMRAREADSRPALRPLLDL